MLDFFVIANVFCSSLFAKHYSDFEVVWFYVGIEMSIDISVDAPFDFIHIVDFNKVH